MSRKMMSGIQLAQGVLTLSTPIWPKLEAFVFNDHVDLLSELQRWLSTKNPTVCWLCGVSSSGKTHLAQALLSQHIEMGLQGAFISGKDARKLSPEMLQGMESLPFLCIDNVDLLLNQPHWLSSIERLSVLMRDRGGCLLLVQRRPDVPHALLGLVLTLQPLVDVNLKRAALVNRAKQQDIMLSDSVVTWLLKHYGDDLGQLMHVLSYLDHASMTLKRAITVPFAKQVLLH